MSLKDENCKVNLIKLMTIIKICKVAQDSCSVIVYILYFENGYKLTDDYVDY